MFDFLKERKQRASAVKNLKVYESMLDVADVKTGYDYWRNVLIGKIVRMFDIEGLPDTVPATEAEKITLLTGKAGLVRSEYGIVAVPASPYGVGLYPTYHPRAIWATPLVEGDGIVNKDIVIIRNDSFLRGISETIDRYARLLADVESTLAITLVNVRQPSMAAAPDEETAYSYQAAHLAMRLGDTEAILNESVLDDIKTIEAVKTIPTTLLKDIVDTRDNLLSQFFSEFGVATRETKKAPMTTTEVATDVQITTVSVLDMLESRKESYAKASILGLDVTVKLNKAFRPILQSKPETFNKVGETIGEGSEVG